jgi:2,4-dienoyl-CoA reductase-like NADH-dependent reductase (Old Yellow Enzyme family)
LPAYGRVNRKAGRREREKMSLDKLFSPVSIGTLELKNRIVMPPMGTNFATTEGLVTERQIAYYVERAKGGAGTSPSSIRASCSRARRARTCS